MLLELVWLANRQNKQQGNGEEQTAQDAGAHTYPLHRTLKWTKGSSLEINHPNANQRKAGMAALSSDKADHEAAWIPRGTHHLTNHAGVMTSYLSIPSVASADERG